MAFTLGHALLIGVGAYQHEPRLNVPVTAADARAVADVIRDPALCGYPDAQVKPLRFGAASREGILAALNNLAVSAGEGDTVFLFFCGHGEYGDDGDYYLTTYDTRLKNGKVVSGTGLRQSEFIEKLRAIKAKRLLLVVNACHSGELAPTLGASEVPFIGKPLPAQTAAALLSTGEGRIIIAACREQQASYVGSGELTLFTEALVNGLRGNGTSSSHGYISAFDLYTHLYFTVEEAVRQKYGAKQEPELTVLKGVGPFAVALYRGATTLGKFDSESRPPEGTAVREIDPAHARAMLIQIVGDTYQANLIGSGAAVQGGGDALGERSVKTRDNYGTIVTGTRVETNTGGGAYIGGNLYVARDFVGRDKVVHGDQIETGELSGIGIAIGRRARADVTQGVSPRDLEPLFATLLSTVAQHAPPEKQAAAVQQVQELKAEVAKGKQADDRKVAKIVEGLVGLVPKAVGAVVSTFAMPILGGIAGPVTKCVLEKLRGG